MELVRTRARPLREACTTLHKGTEHTSWKQFSRQRSSPTSTPPALPLSAGPLLDVDFTAYQGEYLGIIGHTGSGKSTLIQHLNGLLKPTSGQVLFQGTDI